MQMAAILSAVGLFGFPLVRGIPQVSRPELAAWSWVAGLLALAGGEGTLLLIGVRPDRWKLWGLLAAVAFVLKSRPAQTRDEAAPPSRLGKYIWTLALGGFFLFAIEAVSEPMWAWDFVAIWGLKGKTLFLAGGLPNRFFHDPQLAFTHPAYPLLLPVLFAALSTLAGGWNSQALALLYPGFELATLLLVWGFLRRRSSPAGAAAGIVLTAGLFPLFQSYLVGLADIPLALGFVLAGTALLDALDAGGARHIRPVLLAAIFCSTLKKEGSVFLLLLAATAALRAIDDRRRSSLTAAAVLAVVPLCHRAVLSGLLAPASDPDFRWSMIAQRDGAALARRLSETGGYLLHAIILPSLPALLAAAMIFVCTRRAFADLLLPPLAVLTGLYAVAPAFSTWDDPALLASSSFGRIAVALVPTLFLALGARISASVDRFSLRFSRENPTIK